MKHTAEDLNHTETRRCRRLRAVLEAACRVKSSVVRVSGAARATEQSCVIK